MITVVLDLDRYELFDIKEMVALGVLTVDEVKEYCSEFKMMSEYEQLMWVRSINKRGVA